MEMAVRPEVVGPPRVPWARICQPANTGRDPLCSLNPICGVISVCRVAGQTMSLIVQKFGGTSVADAGRIRGAARRAVAAHREGHQVVVVVSARGKKTDELVGLAAEITDSPSAREMDMLLSTGEQESVALMAMAVAAEGAEAISIMCQHCQQRLHRDVPRATIQLQPKCISTQHSAGGGKGIATGAHRSPEEGDQAIC